MKLLGICIGLLVGMATHSQVSWAQSPAVSSLSPPTRTITQGGSSTFTVTLNAVQPTDTVVATTSSAPDVAYVPGSVTVP
ncbi:MAG: hypothetical protein ACREI3_06185, partial [Nitrospirales bacterium]